MTKVPLQPYLGGRSKESIPAITSSNNSSEGTNKLRGRFDWLLEVVVRRDGVGVPQRCCKLAARLEIDVVSRWANSCRCWSASQVRSVKGEMKHAKRVGNWDGAAPRSVNAWPVRSTSTPLPRALADWGQNGRGWYFPSWPGSANSDSRPEPLLALGGLHGRAKV